MPDPMRDTAGVQRPSDHTRVGHVPGESTMTMSNPIPRRPALRDLHAFLAEARAALRTARDELVAAAVHHTGRDSSAALALAQLAAGVDAVAARVPGRWPSPVTADKWLAEADFLHAAVTTARLGLWKLQDAADRFRPAVPMPAALAARDGDFELFGRMPQSPDGRWTDPQDLWDLQGLDLAIGSLGWERRAAVVTAARSWARERQARAEACGVEPLRDASVGLTSVLGGIVGAALELRAILMPAIKAKARLAVRALVEEDDDPADLAGLAREFAAEQRPGALDALAWSAVADLLAMEAQR